VRRLRAWWNRWHDLPRVRGGNLSLIPLEVRDTDHENYPIWATFLRLSAHVYAGPRATLLAWTSFLQACRYHRNLDEDA
jgi:hypothetical protein